MSIAERLAHVRGQIREAARRAGRSEEEIRLLAVSKTKPIAAIEEAYQAGLRDFGENYAQELAEKAEALKHLTDVRWHMIGHLQRNKVKLIVPHASFVHTVDSPRLAHELGKRVVASRAPLRVLVQVNVAGERQKSGCAPADLDAVLEAIEAEAQLELTGLMTIPPQSDDASESLEYFRKLARLREGRGGVARLPELSMGMSHDFPEAIFAGATTIRVGTSIFGAREPRP